MYTYLIYIGNKSQKAFSVDININCIQIVFPFRRRINGMNVSIFILAKFFTISCVNFINHTVHFINNVRISQQRKKHCVLSL